MTDRPQADVCFSIERPPQSCLELLVILRRWEAFVTAKIRWKTTWPAVKDETPRVTFPWITYDGPTQSPENALLAEHHARRHEFEQLQQVLPQHFTAIELRPPEPAEFQIPEIVLTTGSPDTSADCDQIRRVSEQAAAFWVRLATCVQCEVFRREELIPNWMPEVVDWSAIGDPPANRKVYPPFPIRSLIDLETWLGRWIDRCALPEPTTSLNEPGTIDRQERFVTIKVPSERPPFQSPVEKVWRCHLEDLTRELRNCSRAFLAWGIPIDKHWEGDPPDFSTAEDRVAKIIDEIRSLRLAKKSNSANNPKRKSPEFRRTSEELFKSAMRRHHQYENGCVGNYEPATTRQIEELIGRNVSDTTVQRLLKKHFRSIQEYRDSCVSGAIRSKLVILLGEGLHAFGTLDPTETDLEVTDDHE